VKPDLTSLVLLLLYSVDVPEVRDDRTVLSVDTEAAGKEVA